MGKTSHTEKDRTNSKTSNRHNSSKKLKALAIVHRGFEKVAADEINEILCNGNNASCKNAYNSYNIMTACSRVTFEAESLEQLAGLCYLTQSLTGLVLVLNSFPVKENETKEISAEEACLDKSAIARKLEKAVDGSGLESWLKERTFRVNCLHTLLPGISGHKVAAHAGGIIAAKTGASVKMQDPDVTVIIYLSEDECFIGIDLAGFDLSKRDYKIYVHSSSLNGAVAYSLLRAAGFSRKSTVLDPFCGSGIIPIEAALYLTGRSPNLFRKDRFAFHRLAQVDLTKYDTGKDIITKKDGPGTGMEKNNHKIKRAQQAYCSDHLLSCVKATRNNAKIAGIDKVISVTKADLEWLDTKYDEKSFDIIATHPPVDSKITDKKDIEKLYREFFNQAEFILKDNGRIAVLLTKAELFRECIFGFGITEEFNVYQGMQEMTVLILKKIKKIL